MYNSPQCFYICCRIWKWMRNNSLRAAVLSRFLLLEVCLDNVLSQTLHTLILGWFLNKLYGLPYYTLFMHINLSREVVCGNSFLMLAYLTGGFFFFWGGGGTFLCYPGCFPLFVFADFFVPSLSHFTASATVLRRRFLHPGIFYLALLFPYFCAFVA